MAGMPPELINRANEILALLEQKTKNNSPTKGEPSTEDLSSKIKSLSAPQMQLSIYDTYSAVFEDIRKLIENIDINRLTPVEALMKLNEIKGMLK
jgi:DNA mismatch repair protein MutS